MREIKFRAWDKNDKRMVDWAELFDYICTNKTTTGMQGLLDRAMQYTSLKDKNGKEIYDKDVVIAGDRVTAMVDWHDGCWWLGSLDRLYIHGEDLEVIGNIYENKELLHE